MLGLSLWKILILAGVVTLMFGRGRVSELMGDVAKGIKSFKRGLAEDEDAPKAIAQDPAPSATAPADEKTARAG